MIFLVHCFFSFLSGTVDNPAGTEKDPLQGIWKVRSLEFNGQILPAGDFRVAYARLTIEGNRCFLGVGEARVPGTMKIDPENPRHIDFTWDVFGERYNVAALYEIKAGVLRICCGNPDMPRPQEFKSRPQSDVYLVALQRINAKKSQPHLVPPRIR
jgi:uncharacterized protein (TIGR03067 family)